MAYLSDLLFYYYQKLFRENSYFTIFYPNQQYRRLIEYRLHNINSSL